MEQNWTQFALDEKLDFSDRQIRNLCKNDTDTKLSLCYKMSRVLGTAMEELLVIWRGRRMSTALLEKTSARAESYRTPMQVTQLRKYRTTAYYICPRCSITMEREFIGYCDRCGQSLNCK